MAQYRGLIEGTRGETSRLGSKTSGLKAKCDGWNIGTTSIINYNKDKQRDEIEVWITSGSKRNSHDTYLGSFYRAEDGATIRISKSEL